MLKTRRGTLSELSLSSLLLLTTLEAAAAELEPVNDWDRSGLPADVSMYAYVPDNVAASPPLLVLIHYCGGTAPAVFGQARGGGLVQAADEFGFMLIVPSSGRCWDVVSDATRRRDGNGDSHAIRRMVAHAVAAYGANPERVYATGDSSGGMMTELLLALYPDVFKAGSAMAGMPAGCRGDNESGNGGGYSGACAGGNVSRSEREWGDLVRSLSPGYTGARPRVQLFHGDDDDLIDYSNHAEALKQWRDVLGLEPLPTSTDGELLLGTHRATRQTWSGECGRPVLDAFTSLGGDHGPSDALFLAEHLVPFLALDDTGLVDPVVAACQDTATDDAGPPDAGNGRGADAGGAAAPGSGGGSSPAPSLGGIGALPGADVGGDGSSGAPGSMGEGPNVAPGAGTAAGSSIRPSNNSAGACSLPSPPGGARGRRDCGWLALSVLALGALWRARGTVSRRQL